jgi:hypothetical protein
MTDERLAELERWQSAPLTEDLRFTAAARTALPELVAEVRRLRAGLAEIASYGEGPTVTGKFDEPTAARLARKILEGS